MYKPILVIFISIFLAACSPKFDWREVDGKEAPYKILMPAKPAEMRRDILLGTEKVTMVMTAAQVDGVNYAIGAARMSDATKAMQTLAVIKSGLVRNLNGKITAEANSAATGANGKLSVNNAFTAISASAPMTKMSARLSAQGEWVFQILVVGPAAEMNGEAVETFLNSFQPTGS